MKRVRKWNSNARGEGLLFFINQDLNCKVLTNYPTHQDFEILALELKLSKTNWLVIGIYKPPSLSNIAFTSEIRNILSVNT